MGLLDTTQSRLLTATAVLAGATVCGGVWGAAAAGVAGGVVASELLPMHLSHVAVRLRGSGDKLKNHDLTAAVGLAMGLVVQSMAEAGTYPNSTQNLKKLARYCVTGWEKLAPEVPELSEDAAIALFAKPLDDYVRQPVLEREGWVALLRTWLEPGADIRDLPEYVRNEVATQLRDRFALALREVIKADFAQDGKAFAAMVLALLGELAAGLRNPPAGLTADPALGAAVAELRTQLQGNAGQFCQLANSIQDLDEQIAAEFARARDWLQGQFQAVLQALGRIETGVRDLQDQIAALQAQVDRLLDQQPIAAPITTLPESDLVPSLANWQERPRELATVGSWLDNPNAKLGVITGLPGTGKSTLAAKVYQDRTDFVGQHWLDLGRRPTFGAVARRLLVQWGNHDREVLERQPEEQLSRSLLGLLQSRRYLLVLDNLESLLLVEADGSTLYDQGYRVFFQTWLDCGSQHGQSELLITSQAMPTLDWQGRSPQELPLGGLDEAAALGLLAELGLEGDLAQQRELVRLVGGHPLTLRLVVGALREARPGQAPQVADLFAPGSATFGLGQVLQRAQGGHRGQQVQMVALLQNNLALLPERLRRLVLWLPVLRLPFGPAAATALAGEPVTAADLWELVRRGLAVLAGNPEAGRFELQPFVAAYLQLQAQLQATDLPEAHRRAIAFYRQQAKPREAWQSLDDVQDYLEIFHHCCELEEWGAAFEVIRNSQGVGDVDEFLTLRGYSQTQVSLYDRLVTHWPEATPKTDWRYGACLTSLGLAYHALGESRRAIDFYQQWLEIAREIGESPAERLRQRRGEAISLGNLGLAYHSLGEYRRAIDFYQQQLEIAREIGDRRGEAASLGNLGVAYKSLGESRRAIDFHQQSLEIKREIGDRRGEANSLGNLGNAYHALGESRRAIDFYQQSLEIAREIGDRRGEANSLGGLGNAYYSLGESRRAIDFYQQQLEIAREIGDRGGEATSLGNLGVAYHSLGESCRAINFHQQQLEIAREIGDRGGEAISLGNLGNAYYSLGESRRAIDFHQQSLEIKREIGDRGGEANSLGNLGNAYDALGEYHRAIDFYQQQLEIAREIDDRRNEANALGGLGIAYHSLGEYRQAIDFLQQQLEIVREIGHRGGEANSLGNLGVAYQSLGESRRAIDFHQQSLEIEREIGNRGGEANSLGGLGNAYHSLGEYRRAIDFHQQSLEIAREIGDRSGEANALGNLGNAYHSLGEYRRAIDFYQQSLEIAREIGDRGGEANSLGGLGNAYKSLGEYRRAIDFYQQSLEIAREIGDRGGEANSLGGLGNAYDSLGESRRAIDFYQQWLEIAREIGDRRGEANSLFNMGLALAKCDRGLEAHQSYSDARDLFQELGLNSDVENCQQAIQKLNTQKRLPRWLRRLWRSGLALWRTLTAPFRPR